MRHTIIALIALLLLPGLPFPYLPVVLEVTAYTDACGIPPRGITASGAETRWGIAAADPTIPFGTRAYVNGYGWATVEDRGGAIKGRRMDLWMPTKEMALEWGRQDVRVWLERWW